MGQNVWRYFEKWGNVPLLGYSYEYSNAILYSLEITVSNTYNKYLQSNQFFQYNDSSTVYTLPALMFQVSLHQRLVLLSF